MNISRNLTDLPMEVLSLIFKELPSLAERLSLAQVHPHLGLAFSCYYGQSFKDLYIGRKWNVIRKMLPVILKLCGSSVEYIYNTLSLEPTEWKLVEEHCPNLQCIQLFINVNNSNIIKSFLANVRSLRSIALDVDWSRPTHLGNPSKTYSDILELLKFQPNLRMLHLSNFCSTEVVEVRNLVNLEKLIIDSCLDANLNIHELCHRLKKLRTLEIRNQVFTASKEFDGVPCPALRELHIREFLRCFPNRFLLIAPDILKWILSHAERLEILTLGIKITDYQPEMLVYKILSECKNLRSFSMRMSKADIDFAHRVVKIVSENGVASEERPLELYFYKKIIHIKILKVMANTSTKQLITIKNFKVK